MFSAAHSFATHHRRCLTQQGRLGFLWQAAHLPSPPLALGDWLPILALLIGLGKELRVRVVSIARYQPCPEVTPPGRKGSVTSGTLNVTRTGCGAGSGCDRPESFARDQHIQVPWLFTYWLFLESLEVSVALLDLLGKQTGAPCSEGGCSKTEGNLPEVW